MKPTCLLAVVCFLALTHRALANPAPAVDPAILQSIRQKAMTNLDRQDNHDYQTILASVASGGNDVTPADHKRFWAVLDKMKATPQEMSYFVRTLASGFQYRTDLFGDALIAYERHAPYRSPKRAADEAFLLAQATGTPEEQQRRTAPRRKSLAADDEMIAKIAARKPVFLADTGETVVFDEERIRDTQVGTAIIQKRLLFLLKRP